MRFRLFEPFSAIRYGFSLRKDGSMDRHREGANRERYFGEEGIDPHRVITADLAHGVAVATVTEREAGAMIPRVDGLATNEKDIFLSATGADCFLLYFYDPVARVVGIAHAGWRGTLGGIVKSAIDALASIGAAPEHLLAGIGPGIRSCHFEISAGDRHLYERHASCVSERDGRVFVNLSGIIVFQLEEQGIKREHIEDSGICTYCATEEYFSYRRDKPERVQPMVGYIGVTEERSN